MVAANAEDLGNGFACGFLRDTICRLEEKVPARDTMTTEMNDVRLCLLQGSMEILGADGSS
jgi:hypothetical protein